MMLFTAAPPMPLLRYAAIRRTNIAMMLLPLLMLRHAFAISRHISARCFR